MLGAILVGVGVAPLGRRYLRALEDRAESTVRALCDHFVPGHDGVPGAVALGIDRRVVAKCRETRRGRLGLLLLAHDLDGHSFFAMADNDRKVFLSSRLALGAQIGAPRDVATMYKIYHQCMYEYLTNPDTWAAFHYRTPQPHGYPDYTECVAN